MHRKGESAGRAIRKAQDDATEVPDDERPAFGA